MYTVMKSTGETRADRAGRTTNEKYNGWSNYA